MTIQSILFDKSKWTLEDAYNWLIEHDYKTDFHGKPVDITSKHYRFRQEEPRKEYRYITKNIGDGIEFIIITNFYGHGMNEKIPLKDAQKYSKQIIKEFAKKNIQLISVGSVGRESKQVGDLDFITSDDLGNGRKYIRSELETPKGNVNIDIWSVKPENFDLGYYIRSYPRHYIIAIRKGLHKRGYFLSDQEIFNDKGKKIKFMGFQWLANLAGVVEHPLTYYKGKGIEEDLSNEAYKEKDKRIIEIDGYVYDNQLSTVKTAIYHNDHDKIVIIAHRGTKGLEDISNDILITLGLYEKSKRIKNVTKLVDVVKLKYPNYKLINVGHSLGATTASIIGLKQPVEQSKVVGFNEGAFIPTAIKNQYNRLKCSFSNSDECQKLRNKTLYTTGLDPISILGSKHVGETKFVTPKSLNVHSLSNFPLSAGCLYCGGSCDHGDDCQCY